VARNHVEAELDELIAAAYAEALGPYIEAVASTIEGKPNAEAWADFQTVMAKAFVLTQMLGLAVVVKDSEDAGVEYQYDTGKSTFAKDWPVEAEMAGFEVAPYQEAIELFEERIPMIRSNAVHMAQVAEEQALQIAQAEKLGVAAKLDGSTNALADAANRAFWVTDVDDQSVLVDLRKLIADSMRGVSADNVLQSQDFVTKAAEIVGPDFLEGQQDAVAARLETVFRTNLSTAFNEANAAAYRSSDVQDIAPLIMLTEIDDNRSRPHHAAMDGYVNTSEYFDRMNLHPPNGYNCRGGTRIITWSEAGRMGFLAGEYELDWKAIGNHNREMQSYIDGGEYPDPGFSLLSRVA
tara:strand:+ start:1181 stop:2233 length:1053 start_codon:yes stop_codon:yes gene_type:complete